MTAHTNNPRPEQRHAAQEQYQEFYDDDAAETAAWLNACACGEGQPVCVFCHQPLCCGPDIAACDARDHCDEPDCRSECSLCRSMARDDRRGP